MQINPQRERSQNQLRMRATKVFHSCPRCISPNVLKLDGEVVCTYCGWDSIELQSSLQNPMKVFSLQEGAV